MSKEQSHTRQDEARFQFRITVDAGMGPFHDWLTSLPQSVRSRELLYLMRLGFSVAQGGYFPTPGLPMGPKGDSSVSARPGASAVDPDGSKAKEQVDKVNGAADEAAREQVADFDAKWDIVSMCTPPPLEALRRH